MCDSSEMYTEVEEAYAVIEIPVNTIGLTITAKIWQEDSSEVVTVSKTLLFKEVKHAIEEADKNYIPDDATFVTTDAGREYLENLKE